MSDPREIAIIPRKEWNFSDNSAEELVTELMGYLKEKSQESYTALIAALGDLSDIFASASMPSTSVNYDHVNEPLTVDDLSSLRPDAPTFPNTNGIVKPSRPDTQEIEIPLFPTIPTFTEDAPTNTFNYSESPYSSDILTQLKSSIYTWLRNGGVEMDAMIDAAMDATWTRARLRLTDEWSEEQRKAMGFYPSRGWNLHNGAQNAILRRVNNDFQKRLDELNSEIIALEADLKIKNRQFMLQLATTFETTLMEIADKTANRLFEAAKTTFTMIYEGFKHRVTAYTAVVQGKATEIEAKSKIIDARVSINKNKVDLYNAEMSGYKTEIDAVLGVIDGEARLYAAKVGGYEADIKSAQSVLDARVERLKALISQSTDQTNLQIKEAEIELQTYINSLGLNIETAKAVAQILAQIAASSLGALNTHTSMTDGTSRSFGSSYSHSEGISNSKSHSFSEQAGGEE